MKQLINDVLEDIADSQPNLHSEAARENISTAIMSVLKAKGSYKEYTEYELDEQKAKKYWVCDVCNKSTFEVEDDYLVHPKLHLGCALKEESKGKDIKEQYIDACEPTGDDVAKALGHMDKDGEYVEDIIERGKDRRKGDRREKNWSQKNHEEKVFPGVDAIQKQAYTEMTSDGLPEGGDAQAVLESHRLADEIVDNQKGKWIYESPDGGKTVFRRPFSDYDPKNKEEIDFKTKEPTGRKFTEYNGGKWNE